MISRGYGSKSKTYPLFVTENTNPIEGGDEPVLIAKRTNVPVVISPNRQQAIELLLSQAECDIIVSDDGLQHYQLQRDLEIVVMDAERALGNGFVLPAGPLRELPSRLKSVDFVITNGGKNQYSDAVMRLVPHFAINLKPMKTPIKGISIWCCHCRDWQSTAFFTMLEKLGIQLERTQAFQDHQYFEASQLEILSENQPLFMTEKDAVKCQSFANDNWWYVPVDAEIIEAEKQGENLPHFWDKIDKLVAQYRNG